METIRKTLGEKLPKRPVSSLSVYVVFLVVFSFFLLTPINKAYALNCPAGSAGNLSGGGCEDSDGNPVNALPDAPVTAEGVVELLGGPSAVDMPSNGVCPSGYTPAPRQGGVAPICERNDTVGQPGSATAGNVSTNTLGGGKKLSTEGCGGSFFDVVSNPVKCLLQFFAYWALTLASYILWMAGVFLNFAAVFTLNFSAFTSKLNIDATWATIRDMMNIIFIFTLLWVSINTILGLGNDAKKLLASIIISALLINFSLFFTKVAIDVSNVVALQFYTGITGGKFLDPNAKFLTDGGISDQFMSRLKLTSIYNAGPSAGMGSEITGKAQEEVASLSGGNIVTSAIMGTIFILITAFVFFAAGLMLAARSAVLVILMVTSPIGFIGGFIPKLATYTKKWQEELTNQVLFAPIFFMLIWMILKMTESKTTDSGATLSFAAATASGDATFISVIFNYVILIAFIIAALIVAKELSGKAGGAAGTFFGKGLNLGGFALRNTVGRGAAMLAGSERFKDFAGKDTRWGRAAMLALKGTEGVAKSTFNPMALGDTKVGKLVGAVGGMAGVTTDLGKVNGVGGFRKAEQDANKARIKKQEDAAKLLEMSKPAERKLGKEKKAYDDEKKRHDDAESKRIATNKPEKDALLKDWGSEDRARQAYDHDNGEGAYDKKFSAQEFTKEAPALAKTINEARKGGFAEQLKTPTAVKTYTTFPSNLGSDIQAGEKIGRASEDLNKISKDLEDMNENLGKLLTKALGQQIDTQKVTSEQIRKAVSELNTKASITRDEIRENKNMTRDERKARHSEASLYQSDAQEINLLRASIERARDRLDRKTTDAKNSASKGDDKPKTDDKT